MGTILLKNIRVDGNTDDMLIRQDRIHKIGPAGSSVHWDLAGDFEVIECSGKVAIPGFVNMHTHNGMTLMRGVGEDMVFQDWIKKIWEIEEKVDYDMVYWATKVACIEMIKSGTTTYNDQYWCFRAGHDAAVEMGVRPALGYDIMDKGDPAEAERQKEQCTRLYERAMKDWAGDGSIYTLSFHAIYSVSEEMMCWAADFARKHSLPLHIHLSETRKEIEDCKAAHGGLTPVEYLAELGILGPNLLAAHTLWLTEHDIELLAKYGVHCIHNINSNLKLASGYRFLYNELRDAGVNVCIGTDGCASSNNLDLLEAMKTAAMLQKAWRDDPKALPLDELLDVATVHGARALGLDSGVLREGALADLSIIDTDNTYFLSPGPFLANLVYGAHSDCIDSVICGGRVVMRHREVPGERKILDHAKQLMTNYF